MCFCAGFFVGVLECVDAGVARVGVMVGVFGGVMFCAFACCGVFFVSFTRTIPPVIAVHPAAQITTIFVVRLTEAAPAPMVPALAVDPAVVVCSCAKCVARSNGEKSRCNTFDVMSRVV